MNQWESCPYEKNRGRWKRPIVSLNPRGHLRLCGVTHRMLNEPTLYVLMYDRLNDCIGLKPVKPGTPNAYPARRRGGAGRIVYAARLMSLFDIRVENTIRFPDARIDHNGILVLNLRKATPVPVREVKREKEEVKMRKGLVT